MNQQFERERAASIAGYRSNSALADAARQFFLETVRARYSYNFDWLSRPIIQYPQDIVAVQELVWRVKPDLIVETGIAHGGSLILSASLLALLDFCDAAETGQVLDPRKPRRKVIGIDIDVRPHNRAAIEAHPLSGYVRTLQGSSIDAAVVDQVKQAARTASSVMILLDSNHTHEHVLAELEAYAPLTTQGSYCCVFDTVVEDLPGELFGDRPWGRGNSPRTAVAAFLDRLRRDGRRDANGTPLEFEIDAELEDKLAITVAPGGYLKRVAR